MDAKKTGDVIRALRTEQGMTQQMLAEKLHVSAKAVSKWETGAGCPDVALIPELAALFSVPAEVLLTGELDDNQTTGDNMKKTKFYVCPHCGNVVFSARAAGMTCCGRSLAPLEPQKAADEEKLRVEVVENDYFITTEHPMEKEHSITFAALLTGDTVLLRRLWPEWNMQVRFPRIGRGMLVWHCSRHGLFYQYI